MPSTELTNTDVCATGHLWHVKVKHCCCSYGKRFFESFCRVNIKYLFASICPWTDNFKEPDRILDNRPMECCPYCKANIIVTRDDDAVKIHDKRLKAYHEYQKRQYERFVHQP